MEGAVMPSHRPATADFPVTAPPHVVSSPAPCSPSQPGSELSGSGAQHPPSPCARCTATLSPGPVHTFQVLTTTLKTWLIWFLKVACHQLNLFLCLQHVICPCTLGEVPTPALSHLSPPIFLCVCLSTHISYLFSRLLIFSFLSSPVDIFMSVFRDREEGRETSM
ncbi:hypothetical protein HJG60_011751 [Phyllostomus discolor]|uniref:Uncharacterized protein n=1 Tax=Phyllostomus discolor TaxID=89673 RepID=A0A833ZL14_9CHIR|nr:hypothetical protein HJG60_011751 [Phyllostomus discolor]